MTGDDDDRHALVQPALERESAQIGKLQVQQQTCRRRFQIGVFDKRFRTGERFPRDAPRSGSVVPEQCADVSSSSSTMNTTGAEAFTTYSENRMPGLQRRPPMEAGCEMCCTPIIVVVGPQTAAMHRDYRTADRQAGASSPCIFDVKKRFEYVADLVRIEPLPPIVHGDADAGLLRRCPDSHRDTRCSALHCSTASNAFCNRLIITCGNGACCRRVLAAGNASRRRA